MIYHTHTALLFFFIWVLAAVFYWSSSLSPLTHFSFKCFMSTCGNIYFELQWPSHCFFMLFSPYFLIFQITSSFLFLPSQHQCNFWPNDLKGIIDRLINMILIHNFFHHFHDNGCISILMFVDCPLNYAFHFFLNLCCPWPSWDT